MQHTHLVSPQYSLEALLFCGFAGHTMLLRKEFIQTSEYWIDKIGYDWSLAICAQLHRGIAFVDEPLNWHRTNTESVCHVEMKRNGRHVTQHPTYQPYLYGLRNFRRLQKKSNWQKLYSYIYVHTEDRRFELVHSMAHCMLSRNLGKLLQLCYLCMKHSDSVYYRKSQKGFMGKVRAFCYPFIFSYNNVQYDRK